MAKSRAEDIWDRTLEGSRGWDPTHPPLAPPPLPRPAFLRTWHRRPGEGKAQEVAKEEEEKVEEEEEEDEEG